MKKYLSLVGVFMMFTLMFSMSTAAQAATTHFSAGQQQLAAATCQFQIPYPDASCTPGDIFTDVTTDQVCTPGYSSGVRNVPQSVKNQVYAEYGIASHVTGQYEVDHFIPLELGGSNAISNLWPEPASPTPGFHQKDRVENFLHAQMCSGAMSMRAAQNAIVSDWVAVFNSIP